MAEKSANEDETSATKNNKNNYSSPPTKTQYSCEGEEPFRRNVRSNIRSHERATSEDVCEDSEKEGKRSAVYRKRDQKRARRLTGYPLKGATMWVSMSSTFLQRSMVKISRPLGEVLVVQTMRAMTLG